MTNINNADEFAYLMLASAPVMIVGTALYLVHLRNELRYGIARIFEEAADKTIRQLHSRLEKMHENKATGIGAVVQ